MMIKEREKLLSEEKVKVLEIYDKNDDVLLLKTDGGCGKAILYRKVHEDVELGDEVIVNTTASELSLGTGGWDIVRAVVNKRKRDNVQRELGHIMKGRYLGDQHAVLTVEAPESNTHHLFQEPLKLKKKKILLCELHSMIPVIWFYLKARKINIPVTVIFSDEAALPLQMSKHLQYLKKQKDFLSITVGQAFGAEKEAINIVTALQYAMNMHPESITVISVGPGVVGSNTYYGFSSLAQANWANIVGALNGTPVWVPRLSERDERVRHRGISHHTITPLTELTLVESILPLPTGMKVDSLLKNGREKLTRFPHIKIKNISEERLHPYLKVIQDLSPIRITTMGRTIADDPLFFLGILGAVDWYITSEQNSMTEE